MSKLLLCMLSFAILVAAGAARADDAPDAMTIVNKGIKALGGEEALGKVKAISLKSKTTITINGNDNDGSSVQTLQGLDHFRQEFEAQINGNAFKAVTILAGDKGVRKFGDNRTDLDKEALANQKRTVYLTLIPITLLPLKDKDFKVETIGEEKIDDKPALGIKVTAPDKKDFKLYFDKDSGLPVRMVARVAGFRQGDEFTQETNFSDYKATAGIKKAMKLVNKRDGEKFMTQQITEVKFLDTVDPKTFTEVE